jgi:phage terminase large subunit
LGGDGKRIIDQAFPKEIRTRTIDNSMTIHLKNGSIWQCVGSDNYNSLVGSNPVGIVMSEYSIADPAAWDPSVSVLVLASLGEHQVRTRAGSL